MIWGPVFSLAALIGWFTTGRYFRGCLGRVRRQPRGRLGLVWLAWNLWYAALFLAAELLQARVGFAWTLAGVGAALPLLLYGARLARHGR